MTVLNLDEFKCDIPDSPAGIKVIFVVPVVQKRTISEMLTELKRTHEVKESVDPEGWEGVFILPTSHTTVEQNGPWRGFTTKVLGCIERESAPIFVFAGTKSYENSCSSKATKIILEGNRNDSPFKNSNVFVDIDAYMMEREQDVINWNG